MLFLVVSKVAIIICLLLVVACKKQNFSSLSYHKVFRLPTGNQDVLLKADKKHKKALNLRA
jgi:hypothetical protein